MPKTKKFIDRKNAVTFHLVHRSQRDPLVVDENAPQHVLLPAAKPQNKDSKQKDLHKWGVFFDDDYDYLQHLRETDRGPMSWEPAENRDGVTPQHPAYPKGPKQNIQLPSSVFASDHQEDEGMLNRAAPRPGPRLDLDPDIVAAMDDDFDFSDPKNEIDDDFVAQAMAGDGSDLEKDEDSYDSDWSGQGESSDNEEAEREDELGSMDDGKFTFRDEETKSRFTEYSMTSSIMKRNEQLSLLDSRFEKMYAGYDDTEIGALDCEDIEGVMPANSELLLQYASEFAKERAKEKLDQDKEAQRMVRLQEESSEGEELVHLDVTDSQQKWDCESILSTYSNIYNRPKLIEDPKGPRKININSKTGMPTDSLNCSSGKLTAKALAKLNEINISNPTSFGPKSTCAESVISTLSVLSIRPKNETADEKCERKRLLKEYRQERRIERKANAEAFKAERQRQLKIQMNNKNNVQGNRVM